MDTEQPDMGSEPSVADRLAAFAGQEPEPSQEAPEQAPASGEAAPEAGTTEETFDWEADDGEVVKLPAKAKDAVERWKDYSRKTAETAKLRLQAEDRMRFAEARDKLSTEVFQDATEVRILQTQLQQLQAIDIGQLYATDAGQALALMQRTNMLKDQLGQKQQALDAKSRHLTQALQQHTSTQWELAEQGARERLGTLTEADNTAMLKQILALGFTPEEFKSRFADPRLIHMAYKAAKWDAAHSAAPVKAASKAPPVLKPGASHGQAAADEQRHRDQRARLKKTGRMEDAIALLSRF